jgi:MFS family permease
MAEAVAVVSRRRLGNLKHVALSTPWLGQFYALTPIYTILLQVQVSETVGKSIQGTAVGLATGAGGTIGSCLILFAAHSYPPILVGFVAFVACVNIAGAATFGLVPDAVEGAETGKASGLLSGMSQLGSVASLLTLLVMARAGNLRGTYFAIIAVLVITVAPTLWAAAGEGLKPLPRKPRRRLAEFVAPLYRGDFGWAFFTRLMTVSGLYTVLPFLVFAFRDVQGIKDSANFTAEFELIVTAVAVPFAIAGGLVSDRFGRKRFVYASGAIFALVLLIFMLGRMPTTLVLVLAVVYGLAYGCWGAVDWALGLDTVPDRDRAAKDLGLYHVADSLPRVVVPLFVGALIDVFNSVGSNLGYRVMFLVAVLFYVLGTVFVRRIKSVR